MRLRSYVAHRFVALARVARSFVDLALVACSILVIGFAPACSTPSSARGAVVQHTARASDGVRVAYDVRGAGEPALVFVHCWCGNRSFWKDQLDEFAREHRVIALDLPGHGRSGREREAWSVAGLAADVQAVIEEVNPEQVVLVGSSMGGPISLQVAHRMPGRVIAVVGVDTLHDVEQTFPPETADRIADTFEADFEGTMRAFIGSMLYPDTDPSVGDWIVAEAVQADHPAALALMRDFPNVDAKEWLRQAGVPVRCINAAPRAGAAPATAIESNRKYGDFDAVLLERDGHFPMLETPAEFNVRLREVVASLPRSEQALSGGR